MIVSLQAVLDGANTNWAVGVYFAGTVLAVSVLADHPRWRDLSSIINIAICLTLASLTRVPDVGPPDAPLLHRYIGRANISRTIVDLSKAEGGVPVVVDSRNVIADLFYTARDAGLLFYAAPPARQASNQNQILYPLPPDLQGLVLLVSEFRPGCPVSPRKLDIADTAYEGTTLGPIWWKLPARRHCMRCCTTTGDALDAVPPSRFPSVDFPTDSPYQPPTLTADPSSAGVTTLELVTIRALRPDPLEFHRTAPKHGGDCGFGVL